MSSKRSRGEIESLRKLLLARDRTISNIVTHVHRGGPYELMWSHLRTMLVQDGYEIPEAPEEDDGPSREELCAEFVRLQRKVSRLAQFAQHHLDCQARYGAGPTCSCGLDAANATEPVLQIPKAWRVD